MTEEAKILLDPVDFDALHLSALANGGIGAWNSFIDGRPHCVRGHAIWLDGVESNSDPTWGPETRTVKHMRLGSDDSQLPAIGDKAIQSSYDRITFRQYIKLLNIDVREVA